MCLLCGKSVQVHTEYLVMSMMLQSVTELKLYSEPNSTATNAKFSNPTSIPTHFMSTFDVQVKLLMVGESGVGKTSLLIRYTNDTFSNNFVSTIGIDFKIKTIQLKGKLVKLQLWDTAGQERFRTITVSYFRGAQGILIVYDVSNRESFEHVKDWIGQIEQHADFSVNKILVGNKCDMKETRQVSEEEGQELAALYGIPFFETSPKLNINVSDVFEKLASDVVDRVMLQRSNHTPKPISIIDNKSDKTGCCS